MTPIRVAGLAVKGLMNIGASGARFRFALRPKRLLLHDDATKRAGFC
jgi:hypothetical protein